MIPFWNLKRRRRCPHQDLQGIWGDEINVARTRLWCLACNRPIDGPVNLATIRQEEPR